MNRRAARHLLSLLAILAITWMGPGKAVSDEKVNIGTAVRRAPIYFLPIVAAEERGFFKDEGVKAGWFPFDTGGALASALASGAVPMAIGQGTFILTAARGIALVAVADLGASQDWYFYLLPTSDIKRPSDLRGRKIAVPRMGSLAHVYAQVILKGLGLEKEVKYIAVGGVTPQLATLRAKRVDAVLTTFAVLGGLALGGELRTVRGVSLGDYVSLEWDSVRLYGRRDFIEINNDTVRRIVKAILRGAAFAMAEPGWALERIKAEMGWPAEIAERMAQEVYSGLRYSSDGKISRGSLEGMMGLFIEYGLIDKKKAPALSDLYTTRFTGIK